MNANLICLIILKFTAHVFLKNKNKTKGFCSFEFSYRYLNDKVETVQCPKLRTVDLLRVLEGSEYLI